LNRLRQLPSSSPERMTPLNVGTSGYLFAWMFSTHAFVIVQIINFIIFIKLLLYKAFSNNLSFK